VTWPSREAQSPAGAIGDQVAAVRLVDVIVAAVADEHRGIDGVAADDEGKAPGVRDFNGVVDLDLDAVLVVETGVSHRFPFATSRRMCSAIPSKVNLYGPLCLSASRSQRAIQPCRSVIPVS
jgi:hypothetical protein